MITCKNGHTTADFFLDGEGKTRCRPCRRNQRNKSSLKGKIDGLEPEYGPAPPRDPDLVDWVVLLRAAKEGKAPRRLTRKESALAREWGIYQDVGREFRAPGWTFRHYGDMIHTNKNHTQGFGGTDVGEIEGRLLCFMRETVHG